MAAAEPSTADFSNSVISQPIMMLIGWGVGSAIDSLMPEPEENDDLTTTTIELALHLSGFAMASTAAALLIPRQVQILDTWGGLSVYSGSLLAMLHSGKLETRASKVNKAMRDWLDGNLKQ